MKATLPLFALTLGLVSLAPAAEPASGFVAAGATEGRPIAGAVTGQSWAVAVPGRPGEAPKPDGS